MVINKVASKGYFKMTVSGTPSWSIYDLQGRIRAQAMPWFSQYLCGVGQRLLANFIFS